MANSKFDETVILFFLLLALIGGYFHLDDAAYRSTPNVASIASGSEKSAPFNLLAEPRTLPELHIVDGSGAAFTLADIPDRAVVLSVWATWCIPCRTEVRELARLQESLGGTHFEVVALSVDQGGIRHVRAFLRQAGLDGLNVYVDRAGYVVRDLNLIGLPTTLLIDRSGREVGRALGPTDWDREQIRAAIERVINQAP
jgi:thiol-disulfide isomerase/thioredoxin